jgi:hypothetical protein
MLPKLCELQAKIPDIHMREEMDSYKPNDGATSIKVQQQTLFDTA